MQLLKVQILFNDAYYDGPLSGICLHKKQMLYFKLNTELEFGDTKEDTYYSVRVYELYELPDNVIDDLLFNQKLSLKLMRSEIGNDTHKVMKLYEEQKRQTFTDNTHEEFTEHYGKYCVGYTLEDVMSYTKNKNYRFNGL